MKHYGDITKINGTVVPPVDIITGGSPCQDLSVAGKRAGLAGERSGLFMEQIRIVKEMRNESKRRLSISGADYDFRCVKPRYMVWENVKGAFSSGNPKGADFAIVLEEIVKIVCKECPPLSIPQNGWPHAGCIEGMGDDGHPFSICWRLHDACLWGVPQRRKRIALVADFGGSSAPEILFERKGMSGNNEAVREQGQTITPDAQNGIRATDQAKYIDTTHADDVVRIDEVTAPLQARDYKGDKHVMVLENHPQDSRMKIKEDGIFQTMGARQGAETDPHTLMILEPQVFDASRRHDYQPFDDVSETVNTVEKHAVVCFEPGSCSRVGGHIYTDNKSGTIRANAGDNQMAVVCCASSQNTNANYYDNISGCLQARGGTDGGNSPYVVLNDNNRTGEILPAVNNMVVRRLTPLECERLQGFPDEWTNIGEWVDSKGKKHKDADSPRYKALGNSIALPFWEWMADRMCKQLREDGFDDLSMASLFDGIGGFPLVYSRCGCEPVWASEIEEFPIAVTKYHFGNE